MPDTSAGHGRGSISKEGFLDEKVIGLGLRACAGLFFALDGFFGRSAARLRVSFFPVQRRRVDGVRRAECLAQLAWVALGSFAR